MTTEALVVAIVKFLVTMLVGYVVGRAFEALLAVLRDIAVALREVRDAIYWLTSDDDGGEGDDAEIDNTAPVKPEERSAGSLVS